MTFNDIRKYYGIKEVITLYIPQGTDSYYIATVGDDNALAVTHFSVTTSGGLIPKASIRIQKQLIEPSAHYSSITGKLAYNMTLWCGLCGNKAKPVMFLHMPRSEIYRS